MVTSLLRRYGLEVVFKAVVGDQEDRIARVLQQASLEAALVVVTGGLGPTKDDRTRSAAALMTGSKLATDPKVLSWIEEMYARRGARMPTTNAVQAEVLPGSEVLFNQRGTAPGVRFGYNGATFFLLPGVPREAEGLLQQELQPWLEDRFPRTRVQEHELRVACLPESLVEERLEPLYQRFGAEGVAVLAKPGEVLIRVRSVDAGGSAEMAAMVENLLGDAVFSRAGESGASPTLEATVLTALAAAGEGLTTAESCTGGLIGQRLTSVPGSSAHYLGGAISYSNELKTAMLGVDPAVLSQYGAVSRETAEAMAVGAVGRFGSEWAASVTGIAGPGGGSSEKPVGTVCFGLVGPSVCRSDCLLFPGDRERVRLQASQYCLDLVRRELSGLAPRSETPWMVTSNAGGRTE